jgi:molecular chaperone HtpG
MPDETWPPSFTLDQERILNLLTGDRFYSKPSAALREAVLNAIDAVHRRRKTAPDLEPEITVTFNRNDLTLAVADNGIGMSRNEVSTLFTKVGASAAAVEANKDSVGEFGIGVISYFMAGDAFELQTNDGENEAIGLSFSRQMLAGGGAVEMPSTQGFQGTTVTIQIRDATTFDLLLKDFSHWCRDVEGLSARSQGMIS